LMKQVGTQQRLLRLLKQQAGVPSVGQVRSEPKRARGLLDRELRRTTNQ